MAKVVPPAGLGLAPICPPWVSTMVREIDRRRPCPGACWSRRAGIDETLFPARSRAGVRDADGKHTVLVGRGRIASSRLGEDPSLDGIPQQVEQNLLNLHLVGENRSMVGRTEIAPERLILRADESQGARFLHKLRRFDPAFARRAPRTRAATDDLPCAQSLLGCLSMASRSRRNDVGATRACVGALHVVGNRGERLVELVSQRGRHLAHGSQSGDMDELGLQFRALPRLLTPVRSRMNREEALIARAHFSHGEFHRKGREPALADHDVRSR